MITLKYLTGRFAPMITCDVCSNVILDSDMAVIIHPVPWRGKSENIPVLFAHKGECHDRAEKRFDGGTGWSELTHHLVWLCANAGLKSERMVEAEQEVEVLEGL